VQGHLALRPAVQPERDGGSGLSESVLNNLDADNGSASFRVWLAGLEVFGRGYGTEGTRLVVDYAFDVAGLHRLALRSMSTTRVRAGCTRSAGSPSKGGGEALLWRRRRYDIFLMSMLRPSSTK